MFRVFSYQILRNDFVCPQKCPHAMPALAGRYWTSALNSLCERQSCGSMAAFDVRLIFSVALSMARAPSLAERFLVAIHGVVQPA